MNWGGRVRVKPTPDTYIKLGAYQINPDRQHNSGFGFGTGHSTGFVLPVEAGYDTTFLTDRYPRHYKLGFWFNSADYADPFAFIDLIRRYPAGAEFDIMLESKSKDLALRRLRNDVVRYAPDLAARFGLSADEPVPEEEEIILSEPPPVKEEAVLP